MPSFGLDGQPVIATLRFYENGTTDPATVYSDQALTVPLPWPLTSNTSGQFVGVYAPDDGEYSVLWSTNDGQSRTWDGVTGGVSANAAVMSGAQAAATEAATAQAGAEQAEADAQAILDQIIAQGGDDGFTPVLSIVTDGARRVVGITWTGGDGPPPASGYLGPVGVVPDLASAVDIRGPSGPGTGNVLSAGSPTTGNLAIWSSGTSINGNTAYDWTTLPSKPAFGGAALLNVASQAEALAGASNAVVMSPLRVAQVMANGTTNTLPGSTKAGNYQVVSNDRGSIITLDSASPFTLTFDDVANLGENWFVDIYNANTGDVTLDPSGSQTIDGLLSFVCYPGEIRRIRNTGLALASFVLKGFSKTFTASGTFTKPPGYLDFEGEAWGGGGSGASYTPGGAGPGGGGGACAPFSLRAASFGATETVTVAGGGAASAPGAGGNNGGNTTLGTLLTAYGGAGGSLTQGGGGGGLLGSGSPGVGGAPRVAAADNPGFGGADAASPNGFSAIYGGGAGASGAGGGGGGAGGNSVYGSAGGGTGNVDSFGGFSRYGGNGGRGRATLAGEPGVAPGGGGGGTADSTKASGAGARGELRIRGVT